MKKRLLSTMLALCLVLTMLPLNALATETLAEGAETEMQEDEVAMPETPASIAPTEITADDPTTSPDVDDAGEPMVLAATSGACGDNLTWNLANGTLTISGTGEMWNYSYYSNDLAPWYSSKDSITKIIIQPGVTSIGSYAFFECVNLIDITIPNGMMQIWAWSFEGCSKLPSIMFPNSVVTLYTGALKNCTSLTSVTLPQNIESLGDSLFEGCKSLASVQIPNTVMRITSRLFYDCNSLTNINIPSSVTEIGSLAFHGCSSLANLTIPNSVIYIGDGVFGQCSSLKNMVIPNGITDIKSTTFEDCDNLVSVSIPNSITSIGWNAFYGCSSLKNIAIPNGVTSIGSRAFYGCSGLASVTIPNVTTIEYETFRGCSGLTTVVIPSTVTTIEDYAFEGCSGLTSIEIPLNMSNIGRGTFYQCDNLSDVYYIGDEFDWSHISIDNSNKENLPLHNATIHHETDINGNKHTKPSTSGGSSTKISKKRIGFYSPIGNRIYGMDIDWGWDLFLDRDSANYDYRLAEIGLALSGAAEHDQNYLTEMLVNGGSKRDDNNVKLNGLGFDYNSIYSENYNSNWYEVFAPAVTFAHKTITSNDGKKSHIIIAVVRGTTDPEDFATDLSSIAGGFAVSAVNTYNLLEKYIEAYEQNTEGITKDNVKFFITGHSLGGAVANLLAERLNREFGPKNVFAYTFATPRSTYDVLNINNNNIHNILHAEDKVPVGLSTNISRYGHSDWFSRFEYGNDMYQNFRTITNGGDLQSVMEDWANWIVLVKPFVQVEKFKYGHAVETYMSYLMARGNSTNRPASMIAFLVCCPVDVEVYVDDGTAEGQLVGRITDNVVDESVSSSLYAYTEGDEKYVCLPYEGDYTIKLTATDAGSMDYIVRTINLDTKETIEEKNYRNVALTKGKQMTSAVSVWDKDDNTTDVENKIDTPEVPLYVMDENGNEVFEVLPDGNGTEVYISRTVTFNANGGAVNPTTMVTGTNGKLPNLPTPTRNGYRFRGWYTAANSGTQIAVDTIFTSDATVYAQWSNPNSNGGSGSSTDSNGNSTGGDRLGGAGAKNGNKPETTSGAFSDNTKKSPNTGDDISVIWLSILGMTVIVCVFIALRLRKRNISHL